MGWWPGIGWSARRAGSARETRLGAVAGAVTVTLTLTGVLPGAVASEDADGVGPQPDVGVAATPVAADPRQGPVADVPPGEDPFYLPPTPLTGRPGDVIRARQVPFTLRARQGPVAGVLARQVLYRSTSATGAPNAVSGTVLVPTAPWGGPGPRPLVAFAPGTRGVGDLCAPSYTLTRGTDYEAPFIARLLDRGWAAAVTDYEGLGTPGPHTYMVGQSAGHALLDIARAAARLDGAGVTADGPGVTADGPGMTADGPGMTADGAAGSGLAADGPVGLVGYSEGGAAAGWAGQLAASYAPELQVAGVVAGGIPADLQATLDYVDGGPFVVFALLGGVGFDAAYPELDLGSYLNDRGRALLAHQETACVVNAGVVPVALRTVLREVDDFTAANPLDAPVWAARIAENALGGLAPAAPVFAYHGIADEIVPLGQAARLRRAWCAQGASVRWSVWPAGHLSTDVEASPAATRWLADRFAGAPAGGNCPAR